VTAELGERRNSSLKFKTEVALLVASLLMFVISVFFYSYQGVTVAAAQTADAFAAVTNAVTYPYRDLALIFVGFGAVSMVTATISFSKRSKEII
jgi:hypothetical protein